MAAEAITLPQFVQVLNVMSAAGSSQQDRKKAEVTYNGFKNNPDFLVQALVEIIAQPDTGDSSAR